MATVLTMVISLLDGSVRRTLYLGCLWEDPCEVWDKPLKGEEFVDMCGSCF